jgi:hypothetical protein
LALAIDFAAGAAGSCSADSLGAWREVRASAPRWHTAAGLRVGDGENRLHALYPAARPLDFLGLGHLWEIGTGGPLCDGGPPLSLGAHVVAGRVDALLIVHVPACG